MRKRKRENEREKLVDSWKKLKKFHGKGKKV